LAQFRAHFAVGANRFDGVSSRQGVVDTQNGAAVAGSLGSRRHTLLAPYPSPIQLQRMVRQAEIVALRKRLCSAVNEMGLVELQHAENPSTTFDPRASGCDTSRRHLALLERHGERLSGVKATC
jgi:hypothetical protein